jgi:hypothetical protein
MNYVYYEFQGVHLSGTRHGALLAVRDDLEGWTSNQKLTVMEMKELAAALLKCASEVEG